jgi:hypothetical protein
MCSSSRLGAGRCSQTTFEALPTPIRKCAVAPASVPGAVAAMLLLPIPVALPPNKKRSGAQAGSFFCGGGAGNRTRVLR